MNTKLHPFLAGLCALLISLTRSPAQGTAFTYQGRLESGGSPANGIFDLQFAVFDSSSGGALVARPLTNSATAVSNGLFTTTLDFGAGVFTGLPRWLGIAVRTNGAAAFDTLNPRQPITATPYALHAAGAGSAQSLSGTISAAQLTGTISSNQIGAGAITADKLAAGAVGAGHLAAGAVTTPALADGAVTAQKVAMATNNNWFALTLANPTPAIGDVFGYAVAAVGADRVLIGVAGDDTGAPNAGATYLFHVNGTLLTAFTNPTPAFNEQFGHALAAVGTDRVLVGAAYDDTGAADAGAAYFFHANGTLLTTFTNPTPAVGDRFGYAVAAVGTDRVLIGAYFDDTGATNAGAAYLFSTNGTLLTTFTNPTPAAGDWFGFPVAAVGTDRVLIGAWSDDTGATGAGAAYLFSTNGTLLTTFTNPTPAADDWFGYALAAVGTDRVLIGALYDDTGAGNAGAAYLFSRESYAPGLIAEGVAVRSITTASLKDGAVTPAKLDPAIGVWTRSGDNVFRPVGNVGIGTGTPQAPLEVVGNNPFPHLQVSASSSAPYGSFLSLNATATAGGKDYLIFSTGASAGEGQGKLMFQNHTDGRNIMALDANGNVGIGTTNPAADLHVNGNTVLQGRIIPTASTASNMLNLAVGLNANGFANGISFYESATAAAAMSLGYDGTIGGTANNALRIYNSAGSNIFTFEHGGFLGLSVVNPANPIEHSSGALLTAAGVWQNASDRHRKTDFQELNPATVLAKVVALPVRSWRYTNEAANVRHIGPMAQDFKALFGLGTDDKSIGTVDADGVALAAIQGLNQKLAEELKRRDAENAELRAELAELKQLVRTLAAQGKGGAR